MGGRGAIAAVVGLGLVAAVCAALLMAALRAGPATASAGVSTAPVVVAASDLPENTTITEEHLETSDVPVSEVPGGSRRDAVGLLGRVLLRSVVKGQPINDALLLPETSGARLAMSLPAGVRAVAIELDASDAMLGLVYPGSFVDVIVASNRFGRPGAGNDSRTLLQNVRVLAVDDKTVFKDDMSPSSDDDDSEPVTTTRRPTRLMVTLMVTPEQARTLQGARDAGTLSLSLRNPRDESRITEAPSEHEDREADKRPPEPRVWKTTVIRGTSVEIQTFGDDRASPGETHDNGSNASSAPTPIRAADDDDD